MSTDAIGKVTWLGPSRDHRTSRWSCTCPACGKAFEPITTMFATQELTCPSGKCRAQLIVNYNAKTITATK